MAIPVLVGDDIEPVANEHSVVPVAAGTPTGIGSLPHVSVDDAIACTLAVHPRLPAAPSLPNRSPLEAMIPQAAWAVSGVTVGPQGALTVDADGIDLDQPLRERGLDGEPFVTLRAFLDAVAGRRSPVKLQLTGPMTLAVALIEAGLEQDRALDLAGAAVRARAEDLLTVACRSVPEAPLVVFLDEPALTATSLQQYGFDGGAVAATLAGAIDVVRSGAVSGIHCCGEADWGLVLEASPSILAAPPESGLAVSPLTVARHLEADGWIAWGAVPTDKPVGTTGARLWKRLGEQWCELVREGCDARRLRTQALVSPACGLASHEVAQAERALGLADGIGRRLLGEAIGVRLSVGA